MRSLSPYSNESRLSDRRIISSFDTCKAKITRNRSSTKGERRKGQRPRTFLGARMPRFLVKAIIVPLGMPVTRKTRDFQSVSIRLQTSDVTFNRCYMELTEQFQIIRVVYNPRYTCYIRTLERVYTSRSKRNVAEDLRLTLLEFDVSFNNE